MTIQFFKMHGLGNDFVILDHMNESFPIKAELVRRLSDRRLGVGCDQVVVVRRGDTDFPLEVAIYNADGSQAEMCGNAIRCVALYLRKYHDIRDPEITIKTLAGAIRVYPQNDGQVTVDMGMPTLSGPRIPANWPGEVINQPLQIGDALFQVTGVSMGNPHCVIFHPDVEGFDLSTFGPRICEHPRFPNRTNVELVQIFNRERIRMRVWERGAGITPACGTGACASVVAAVANGLSERKVVVVLDGGELHIDWDETSNHLLMTGPATEVFQGRLAQGMDEWA